MNLDNYIKTEGASVLYYDTLSSTNSTLKELAEAGASEKTVVIASHQSAGRGRMGRTFISPDGTGLYMSILLKPEISVERSLEITTAAAVAVCRVIKKHTERFVGIKWVNDIYIEGKKVCGILTEACVRPQGDGLKYAILGIGVNLFRPEADFPAEVADIATALFDGEPDDAVMLQIAGEIIDEFFKLYPQIGSNAFVDEYRENSIILGKEILLLKNDTKVPATALAINNDYSLLVKLENGETVDVNSGDVSIKL